MAVGDRKRVKRVVPTNEAVRLLAQLMQRAAENPGEVARIEFNVDLSDELDPPRVERHERD